MPAAHSPSQGKDRAVTGVTSSVALAQHSAAQHVRQDGHFFPFPCQLALSYLLEVHRPLHWPNRLQRMNLWAPAHFKGCQGCSLNALAPPRRATSPRATTLCFAGQGRRRPRTFPHRPANHSC